MSIAKTKLKKFFYKNCFFFTFQGRKLLVLCTSSRRQVLEEMEMISAFTSVLHVPYLSTSEHLMTVLEEIGCFRREELQRIQRKTNGCRFVMPLYYSR